LIVVDTGDRIEGNGLYDGSDPKGKYYYDLFKQQPIDVICTGNHELYKANSSNDELHYTVPNYKNSYIASNLDIINPDRGTQEPLAPRFRKFVTKNQKLRVVSFGFLFDFTGNANNTIVQPVAETIKEEWFRKALEDREVDIILVIGHVGVRMNEFKLIFEAIRNAQWDTPILFFGGHVHIRDFTTYDKNSAAIASGRYLETVGFMSVDGLKGDKKRKNDAEIAELASIKVSRRYIDKNLYSFHRHTGMNSSTFPTKAGKNVSQGIAAARKALKLDKTHGCAPQPLYVNRAPYPSESSLFSWLTDQVFPTQLLHAPRVKKGKKGLVITNTGAMRFDIFKGPFTKDTEFLVSPFTSEFRYVKDVPVKVAGRVLKLLNSKGPLLDMAVNSNGQNLQSWMLAPPEQMGGLMAARSAQIQKSQLQSDSIAFVPTTGGQAPLLSPNGDKKDKPELKPGYTTLDDAGSDGDDTEHSHVQFFDVPNAIQAPIGGLLLPLDPNNDETVDLVYNEFVEPWIVLALQYLGMKTKQSDTEVYWEGKSLTNIITDWVDDNWKCK
jgi:2',3'-cyclic-nucleotide 2'-phosphodiesterase (5'-nucleotidase family)